MKKTRVAAIIFSVMAVMAGPLAAGASGQVKPQFGMETYGGTNKLLILSPWAGVRFGLNSSSSLIFRC
jgi:hypothetical protein